VAIATPDLRLPSQPTSTTTVPWPVLISHPAEGRRLSWPKWLVTDIGLYRRRGHLLTTNRVRRIEYSFVDATRARYHAVRQTAATIPATAVLITGRVFVSDVLAILLRRAGVTVGFLAAA